MNNFRYRLVVAGSLSCAGLAAVVLGWKFTALSLLIVACGMAASASAARARARAGRAGR